MNKLPPGLLRIILLGSALMFIGAVICGDAAHSDETRYVLCVEGVGPACDTQVTYTKAGCAARPQMQGWAEGTNPFYCKSLPPPKPQG